MSRSNRSDVSPDTTATTKAKANNDNSTTATTTDNSPSRRSPRREATRARLLDAARAVFAERGFHGGTVEEICERAGFTRGAFYSNFGSKDDLVLELYEQHAQRLIGRVESLAQSTDPAPGRMLAAVLDVWAQEPRAEEQWYLLQMEFTLHAIRDRAARRAWTRAQARVRRRLATLVQRIADEQRLVLSVSPEELVRVVHSIYQGGLAQHLLEPRGVPRGSLERTLLPLVLDAVVTPVRSAVAQRRTEPGAEP